MSFPFCRLTLVDILLRKPKASPWTYLVSTDVRDALMEETHSKRRWHYFIFKSIVSSLPRTASCEVSLRSPAWEELKNKLFES